MSPDVFGSPPWLILHPQTPAGLHPCKGLSPGGDQSVPIQIVRISSVACALQIASPSAYHNKSILSKGGEYRTATKVFSPMTCLQTIVNEMPFL